jgi:nitrogen-specific signal transduction histidine kinase
VSQESAVELMRQNAELIARVASLTREFAQAEAVTKLSAGVVHDLRNAFHVTLLAAEGLRGTLERPEDVELAGTIVTAAEHGSSLARDLLALTRKEDARTSIVSCSECVARLRRLIQRFAVEQIKCTFEVDPAAGPVMVERPQLDAALVNLSVNARDAMPDGGELRISVRSLPQTEAPPAKLPSGDYVEFAVSDTGTGMDESVLARATEAFFTTKDASGGTGLGLAMANAFASRSGGALLLESELQRGTTVRIVLPRAPQSTHTVDDDPIASAKLDTISKYIRSPALRHALQEWRSLCPANGLPRPAAIESRLAEQSDYSLVLAVESGSEPVLRLLRMGHGLQLALGSDSIRDLPVEGSVAAGTLAAAYRRAFQSRFPSYEYANYSFDGDMPGVFERLILPTALDGKTVSHLMGLIRLSENLECGGTTDHVQTL